MDKKPGSNRNTPIENKVDDERVGTIEELLALDPKTIKAIRIDNGPWVEVHPVEELRDMPPASNMVQ